LQKISRISQEEVERIIRSFSGMKVLVIGDVMLDAYWNGRVERVSPEAPVPVVDVSSREYRPGGAANVALNLKALGASVYLYGLTGSDPAAETLKSVLNQAHIETGLLVADNFRCTTTKTRVLGNKVQMLRIDEEDTSVPDHDLQARIEQSLLAVIEDWKPSVIIFQDYDKGAIWPSLIDQVTNLANSLGIPVTVDPKKQNFLHYRNVTLFKPNVKEIREGLGIQLDTSDDSSVHSAVQHLIQSLNCRMALLTLSEKGICIGTNDDFVKIPAHIRSISDVSGAGDTVISIASLCVASGMNPGDIAAWSNLGGGLVCEKPGVVPVDADVWKKEILKTLL
jgi:rfaE bifunctional protein kinase chain/domain